MRWQHELNVAQEAALIAGKEIMRQYDQFQAIPDAPLSITTAADRDAQEIILKILSQSFPGDAFIAEEETSTLRQLPLEEVGGRMTDRDGHELTYGASYTTKSRGFLASNGVMHGEALQIVRSGEV